MPEHSCFSCKFSEYEVNETDDGNYIVCSKGIDITPEMLDDTPCEQYIRRKLR